MARDEAHREDLMAEATALRERVELSLPGEAEHVIAGFRESGCLSLYFGPDPVFQFDAERRLRRAFVAGDLYRSQGHTLSKLTRTRSAGAVHLFRHDLTPDELEHFLSGMHETLARLQAGIEHGTTIIIAQLPPEAEVLTRLTEALKTALQARLSPSVRKRKD